MDPLQLCIPVSDRSQIGEVRRAISRMAETLALSPSRRGDAAIVATELATNLVRHARDGRMLLQVISHGASGWLELLSVYRGPGMTDVQRCLQDGYSTVGTPGNGLGAVKRLSDEFDVHSTPGKGTVIVSRIATSTAPSTVFTVGAVCLPFPGEEVCGDTWRSVEREQDIAVMVADGLGHGPEAAVAAGLAAGAFEDEPFATSEQFSVPAIVLVHFDPAEPLLWRCMLLEVQVLGLHYLCPAVVNRVTDEADVFGFRYDTLEGHLERGVEWFLLTRNDQGQIRFRIEARWQQGEFPNWWSRVGFIVLSGYYQRSGIDSPITGCRCSRTMARHDSRRETRLDSPTSGSTWCSRTIRNGSGLNESRHPDQTPGTQRRDRRAQHGRTGCPGVRAGRRGKAGVAPRRRDGNVCR